MKATVLRAPGDLTVEERPRPQPAAQQVLVRVGSVGICGSDVPYYEHGRIGRSVVEDPLVLGHEASGTIEEIGAEVVGLPGQRVSVEPGVPDMSCAQCLAGRYNLCPNMRFFATPPIDGAFCEYVVVHAAFAHPVPDEISVTLTGTFRYANTWPTAIGLAASGRVNLDRLVTGHYGLERVDEALAARRRDEHSVKAMVHPHA